MDWTGQQEHICNVGIKLQKKKERKVTKLSIEILRNNQIVQIQKPRARNGVIAIEEVVADEDSMTDPESIQTIGSEVAVAAAAAVAVDEGDVAAVADVAVVVGAALVPLSVKFSNKARLKE